MTLTCRTESRIHQLVAVALLLLAILAFPSAACAGKKVRIWFIDWSGDIETINYRFVEIDESQHTPQGVLDYIFDKSSDIGYPEWRGRVCPKIIHIEHGYDSVAYVRIDGDPDLITQGSGTTGGSIFAMIVTFNLTEFEDIDYVYFVNEGDHLVRGEYGRLDFWFRMSDDERLKYKEYLEDSLNAKHEDVHLKVEKLAEIGDEKTIKELKWLKDQMRNVDYAGCIMTEDEFNEYIDKAIRKIEKRLLKEPVNDAE